MGLLDMFNTGDPQKDAAISRGLLSAGLQLMQAKGKFLPALGQGGMAGLGGYEHEVNRQLAAKRIGLQDQYLTNQIDSQKREAELAKLPGQFYRAPSSPGVDATGGMETAMENPANASGPGGFDMGGYVQALYGKNPVAALQLQSALAPKGPEYKTVGNNLVRIGRDGAVAPVFQQPKEVKEDEQIARLKLIYGDGTPAFKAATQRLGLKMTSHPDPVQVSYGAPFSAVNPATGKVELYRPDNRGGMTPTGIEPPPNPNAGKEKDLTEAQAKATAFLGQMRSASDSLKKLGMDQSALSLQAETALAGGPMNIAIGAKAQQVRQAQDQWSEAFLRFKTGAASTPAEVMSNRKTFFPVIGDKPDQVAHKARMRAQAERDMEVAAGRGTAQLNARDPAPAPRRSTGFRIVE